MRVFRELNELPFFRNPVVTIGTFDGVHVGHAAIIQRLQNKAKEVDGETVVITFEPHPRLVLSGNAAGIELLCSLEEKIEALQKLHVDNVVVVPFTKAFSEISANEYVQDFLVRYFHPHTFIIGYDHHFGKGREGNYHLLEKVKHQYGFQLEEIPMQEIKHSAVSSTKIRAALHNGNISEANELLGKKYCISGKVVHGEQRGRLIGFPTANLEIEEEHKLVPANGVYAVMGKVYDIQYKGMMNIGIRPTVTDAHIRSIEVNLFDFEKDIYGQIIRVEIIDKLRDEKKFESLDALIEQLKKDKVNANGLLSEY